MHIFNYSKGVFFYSISRITQQTDNTTSYSVFGFLLKPNVAHFTRLNKTLIIIKKDNNLHPAVRAMYCIFTKQAIPHHSKSPVRIITLKGLKSNTISNVFAIPQRRRQQR